MAGDAQSAAATAAETKARITTGHELACVWFATTVLGFVFVLTVVHWVDVALSKRESKEGLFISTASTIRSFLMRRTPFFKTRGHGIIFVVYTTINLALSLDVEWSSDPPKEFAKRLGWIAACNLVLITFLALKNTPLAYLMGSSHEKLNPMHQAVGFSTITWMLLHAIFYIASWGSTGDLQKLQKLSNVMGIVAGFAMLTIGVSVFAVKKLRYEVFYAVHVAMFFLVLIGLGMHRPFARKLAWIVCITAGIWCMDRTLRSGRMLFNLVGNTATLTPLAGNVVRVSVRRPLLRVQPGTHAFLWIPSIRVFETHPFTIAAASSSTSSSKGTEFIVKAHNGFTTSLYKYAVENPGCTVRASVDGPYGVLPNFQYFDKTILIAGGSGASFAFGVACQLVSSLRPGQSLDFVWIIRTNSALEWFASELADLQATPAVSVSVYVTGEVVSPILSQDEAKSEVSPSGSAILDYQEKTSGSTRLNIDIEDFAVTDSARSLLSDLAVYPGRPEASRLITQAMVTAKTTDRVIVSACGPQGLMRDVRSSAADIVKEGRRVEFFAEEFGW